MGVYDALPYDGVDGQPRQWVNPYGEPQIFDRFYNNGQPDGFETGQCKCS